MSIPAKPIPEEFAKLFTCDPATGVITRLVARCGRPAGSIVKLRAQKHLYLPFARKHWPAHRAVWFLCLGEQPPPIIDHINGDPTDNRLENLRAASKSANAANSRRYVGRVLPKGAHRRPNGKFSSSIVVNGRQFHLGTYATPELAHEAYMAAARLHFGEFARAA